MSQDFTTTLRLQLREAAEREARRGLLRRTVPSMRPLALAGALAAAVAVVVLAVASLGGSPRPAPTSAAPRVVARLAVADQGGTLSTGFGSLWTVDPSGGAVLRLSTAGGIQARIPIHGNLLNGRAGAGAMWALTDDRLYRIDPKTDRVVARIPLPLPTRSNGALIVLPDTVWVGNPGELLHVDLAANRFDRRVNLEHDGLDPYGTSADDRAIYVQRRDGMLLTLDGRTGRRLALVKPAVDGQMGPPLVDGAVTVASGTGLAAVDARTGRLRWRTNLGAARYGVAYPAFGAYWVQGTPVSGRDQLWKLDPRTGRVLAALPLSDFGAAGMTATRDRLWIMSATGNLTAIG